jgi:hypothetical protein
MAHELMFDTLDVVLALFARGNGRTQSIWHQRSTGAPLLDIPCLDPASPDLNRLLPTVRLVTPIDPETFDPATGLALIKADGFKGRLGHAGGAKRVNWTPAQPRDAFNALSGLIDVGATIEGVFWLNPGRLCIDGALPSDATLFGKDAHDVRFCAVLDFTGGGADKVLVSLTRSVCANTVGAAEYSAKGAGNIFKIRHSKDVQKSWELDAPAFLADYSAKVGEYADKIKALNDAVLVTDPTASVLDRIKAADVLFEQMLGGPLDPDAAKRVNTRRVRELNALRMAYAVERQNAKATGFNPDSVRVAYEAYTNVANHGGKFTEKRAGQDVEEWRPFLNGARSETGRAMALVNGSVTGPALASAMAWIAPPPPVVLS